MMSHLQNIKGLIEIVQLVSLFQNDNQLTIQCLGLFMEINSVCYNVITFIISNFSNFKMYSTLISKMF